MSKRGRTEIRISPTAPLLLALFVLLSPAELLAALLLAALVHELGHYGVLHHFGGEISCIDITASGARMQIRNQHRLSYGAEILSVLAGPLMNLFAAIILGQLGNFSEVFYTFAGANLVLGGFNLLPGRTLDGGRLLWLWMAWCTDPFAADRVCAAVSAVVMSVLLLGGGTLLWLQGGSPFLLVAAIALMAQSIRQKGLVKHRDKR